MARVSLIAKMTAKQGKRGELIDILTEVVAATNEEPGTLLYAMNVSTTDADVVWFYEVYTDQDALATHGGSTAMKAAGPRMADLFGAPPELYFLELIGGKGLPDVGT